MVTPNLENHFNLIRTQPIEALHVLVEEYEHVGTGAKHLHFASSNSENVFLVGLKTVPTDNSGVAHILEHTALCGSEKYPVRDPFFMMIRRSLNTFMNAFTSSDWTAYPFASKNKKDFNNLLEVYLDAVFFSRLDEMDFLQEGHRLEFAKEGDSSSELTYKGVVYNEMKGAMSSPVSQLWQTFTRHLFPTTTYHFNSGGDPEQITDLSYDDLKSFYKKHYHPSNAVFLTFGDIPAIDHQEKMHRLALSRFTKKDSKIEIPDELRYCAPIRIQENYHIEKDESTSQKTHIVVGWLLGHSFDLEQNLEAHLLSDVLFENSAAPLQRFLEGTKLGHAPSPLCGLEDSNREMAFVCGIEGGDNGSEETLENEILGVLQKVADEGVAQERLEAVLHQLELSQREISGDSYPYGLQLILAALPPMLHGGDPVELLDLEPIIEKLREKVKDPEYFKSLVKKCLLDNRHRITLSLKPDVEFDAVRQALLEKELSQKKLSLTAEQQQKIIDQAAILNERQRRKDDESILPKVGIEDVPFGMSFPEAIKSNVADNITCYYQGTNGLVYQQIIVDLPFLKSDLLEVLPIYTTIISALGVGESSYLDIQNQQSAVTGGISVFSSVKSCLSNIQKVQGKLIFSGKALSRNYKALSDLLIRTLTDVRFDEFDRIRELVAQIRARREQSVTSNGHALAMGVASSQMSPVSYMSYQLHGVQGIKAIKALDDALSQADDLGRDAIVELAQKFKEIHQHVLSAKREYLIVSEESFAEPMANYVNDQNKAVNVDNSHFTLASMRSNVKEAWVTSTQVNFCSKAYQTVDAAHPDAPALTVLGGFLRNGFLHRAIREQGGAYGGGASQDSAAAAFKFYSYRDPRLTETFDDFDASIKWLKDTDHDLETLEQAILGVISSIDKPRSPAGEAKGDFHSDLFGRSREHRESFRSQVLKVSIDDLLRVADEYLKPEFESFGLITQSANKEKLLGLGFEVYEL